MVDDNVVEEVNDHVEIGLRGLILIYLMNTGEVW